MQIQTEIVEMPEKIFHGVKFPAYKIEQFVLTQDQTKAFLSKIFREAKKVCGEYHTWHISDDCLKCTDSEMPLGGLTDYNDSLECGEVFNWYDKVFFEANNKKYNVINLNGKWIAQIYLS